VLIEHSGGVSRGLRDDGVNHPEAGDPAGVSGALLIALLLAAPGTWIVDLRITSHEVGDQRRRDARVEERHQEVLAKIDGRRDSGRRVPVRDVLLMVAALRLLRRR